MRSRWRAFLVREDHRRAAGVTPAAFLAPSRFLFFGAHRKIFAPQRPRGNASTIKRIGYARAMLGDDEGLDLETIRRNQKAREPHFAAIGRFVVAFSQLEFTYKHFLGDAIQLSPEDFDAVMSAFDFSKLCNIVRVMYNAMGRSERQEIG